MLNSVWELPEVRGGCLPGVEMGSWLCSHSVCHLCCVRKTLPQCRAEVFSLVFGDTAKPELCCRAVVSFMGNSRDVCCNLGGIVLVGVRLEKAAWKGWSGRGRRSLGWCCGAQSDGCDGGISQIWGDGGSSGSGN